MFHNNLNSVNIEDETEPTPRSAFWVVAEEIQRGSKVTVVRRQIHFSKYQKTNERLPLKEYRHIRDNPEKLRDLVIRLNVRDLGAESAKKAVEIKHAFISPEILTDYETYLKTQIPSLENAHKSFSYLKKYFLYFFIAKLEIPDPLAWHKKQTTWSQALLNEFHDPALDVVKIRLWDEDRIPAGLTIREIIYNANRFMKWLHQHYPSEVPPLKFDPVSKAALKTLDARRKLKGLVKPKWFITDKDWKDIEKELRNRRINGQINLAYHFGLRRAETMGFDLADVKRGFLSLERQLISLQDPEKPDNDILKGKASRRVPYWFAKPDQAYQWIEEMRDQLIHPDTLSKEWDALMENMRLPYGLHDLRRTWITRCFRVTGILPTDIQNAAGHVNIETTMRYKLDDRVMDEETFVPSN